MNGERSMTVIVPALNEAQGLAAAVEDMLPVVERHFRDYEILVFNDGSSDATGEVADALAARHERVRALHHEHPHGLGGVIRDGWRHGSKRYAVWVDGQGATRAEALDAIFARVGEADLVVPYAANQHERPLSRRIIARAFRGAMNLAFRLDLHQYTHLVVCELETARKLRVGTNSHALQAEALIKMIKSGCSYVQVGVDDNFDIEGRKSKAFRLSNVTGVASSILRTLWDVYVGRDYLEERASGLARQR